MKIPVNTRMTAWFIRVFLNLFEFDSMAFFAAVGTHQGFVIMRGNPLIATNGIYAMISNIAEDTGLPEEEIMRIITQVRCQTN